MRSDSTPSVPTLTVYFDGACPVCSREIDAYRRQLGAEHCAWVDASTCDEAALGAGLSRDAALGRFHVRGADGSLVHGTRGFAALWRALPRLAWAGRVASIEPIATLLDAAYAVFLKVRPMWQTTPRSGSSWIARGESQSSRTEAQSSPTEVR